MSGSSLILDCKDQCKHFHVHGPSILCNINCCLQASQDRGNKEVEWRIYEIVEQEWSWSFWLWLNWSLGQQHEISISSVWVLDENNEVNGSHFSKYYLGKVHQFHYHMAEEALICKDPLCREFGYQAMSRSAMQILNRTYFYAPDFDPAMKQICRDITKNISLWIPPNSINHITTRETWHQCWKKKWEDTSWSFHGHYISGA